MTERAVFQPGATLQDRCEALARAMPRSPFDFVPGLDVTSDRRLFVDRATRPILPRDDLRCIHRLPSGAEIAVIAERLPWDSTFFGYDVGRLDAVLALDAGSQDDEDLQGAVTALLQTATTRQITYLFASVDARDASLLAVLTRAGFTTIETRVCYHRSLAGYDARERYGVRIATAADVSSLSVAAREAVNPFDRFHADPFIPRGDADRLMARWVEASILDGFADATLVPDVPSPKAFCTVRYHRDRWDAWGVRLSQPVFSAVSAEYRGWYRKLLSEIHYHLIGVGAQHVYLTTQEQNRPVRRTWEKLGYRQAKTEYILRIVLTARRAS